jgi:hypothetical protein
MYFIRVVGCLVMLQMDSKRDVILASNVVGVQSRSYCREQKQINKACDQRHQNRLHGVGTKPPNQKSEKYDNRNQKSNLRNQEQQTANGSDNDRFPKVTIKSHDLCGNPNDCTLTNNTDYKTKHRSDQAHNYFYVTRVSL